MSAEIVKLDTAPLTDVPAMLRRLADQIEAGNWGKVSTAFMLLPRDNDFPRLFAWGDITGTSDSIVQLEMAKHWLITNLVERV